MPKEELALYRELDEKYRRENACAIDANAAAKMRERAAARRRTFPGFGEEHTNAQWARLLGLNRTTVFRYLQRGLTIEELARIRGIQYPPNGKKGETQTAESTREYVGFGMSLSAAEWARWLNLPANTVWRRLTAGESPEEIAAQRGIIPGPPPKPRPRNGKRKAEVLWLMEILLDRSGYDPEDLKVEIIAGRYRYKITRLGETIGAYDSTADSLWLTSGDCLAIRTPLIPSATLTRDEAGRWGLTADTKKEIFDKWQAKSTD